MKLVTEQLLKDMVLGIDLALEKIPDECDCQAYTESDTNATIHQEEVCQVFSRYHLEAVKSDIEKILSAAEQGLHLTGLTPLQKEEVREMIQNALDTGSA